MALPADFSKIYGSTATGGLTPISNVNYARGWEFVGANPPTKNDFSYLQNLSDLKSQWLYSNKLQRTDPFGDIKSDGTGAVSAALSNLGLIDGSGYIGRLVNVKTITTSGTYTPTAGTKVCYAELQAGGGGGGSAATCAAGQSAGAGGGSSGSYALIKFAPATMPVVIGSGSNGAPANASGARASGAGSTSIAGVTVYGGGGGWSGPPRASFPQGSNSEGRPGSASNTGSATIIKEIVGQPGQGGIAYGAANSYSGGGGNSPLGTGAGGGITTAGSGVGSNGSGYGSGGSGSAVASGSSSVAGGGGTPGVVIIWEYA